VPAATQTSVANRSVAQATRLLAVPAGGSASRPGQLTREMAPPIGLAEALGRAERVVSRQVGRLVAIRSAMALVGCRDRDEPAALRQAADQLAAALDRCSGNDAAPALQLALDVARRSFDSPANRVFAGGSERDVAREIERVVEHLAIVIGAVTPVERNRLVLDGQLLGLDHERARALVDELIDEAGVDSDGQPDQLHDPTALVVVSADGLRVVPVGTELLADQVALRVLLFEP
jgi:hypothetical protein